MGSKAGGGERRAICSSATTVGGTCGSRPAHRAAGSRGQLAALS